MDNKSENIIKIKKASKVVSVISKIIEIFCIVGACIAGAGLIVNFAAHDKVKYFISLAGRDNLVDTQWALEHFPEKAVITGSCIIAIISLIMVAILMHRIIRLCKGIIASDSPFNKDTIQDLKIVGILLTIVTLLGGNIVAAIVCAFVFWAIILIFRHGTALQEENDEFL